MTSIWTIQFQSLSFQPSFWGSKRHIPSYVVELRPEVSSSYGRLNWTRRLSLSQMFVLRAIDGSSSSGCEDQSSQDETVKNEADTVIIQDPVRKLQGMISFQDPVHKLQGMISSFPPIVFGMRQRMRYNFAIGICIATAFLVMAVRVYMVRKSRYSRPGSVADLVRRGQLRSDRRGISRPLKYDDPFDNPLVKMGKNNSTVEMCGKVYRLAPVTLTEKEQAIHQKRRSRAYHWKRPTIFLKEGDSIPPDVDPDTVRWIPANHPFATTASDIDEDLAQNNVYQKHGVPFRIQAEHDALQRKLESLHSDQKLNKLLIDPGNAKDFERAFKSYSKPVERGEENFLNDHASSSKPPLSESEDMQKP